MPIVRDETLRLHPAVREAIKELSGKVSDAEMRRLNYAVEGEHRDVVEVVHEFLEKTEGSKQKAAGGRQ